MEFFDFLLNVDKFLADIITLFGAWTYVILFAVIFAETGLVITPFLPGNSLLFAVGAFAGAGVLDIWKVYVLLLIAAILGDTINYWLGLRVGPKVFYKENSKFFKRSYLDKTSEFYKKHGGKTIILARFLPIIRTFAPFVAGLGKMRYRTFLLYNVIGAFIWITSFTFGGYIFGGLEVVKQNFEVVVIGIILLSLVPMAVEYVKYKRASKITNSSKEHVTYSEIQKTFEE